jgi:hypothetical protein
LDSKPERQPFPGRFATAHRLNKSPAINKFQTLRGTPCYGILLPVPRPYKMLANSTTVRKITAALAVLLPCLLFAAETQAAPVRKHVRPHRVSVRRNLTPDQAFAHVAGRRPDRRLQQHPVSTLRRSHTDTQSTRDDAIIQNDVSAVGVDLEQPSPVLEPLHVLPPAHSPLHSHDGFTYRSPRAPPTFFS